MGFAGTHLYTWVEIGTVRVECLAQEHNTMSPARARNRTARSGVELTNHEATAPPTGSIYPIIISTYIRLDIEPIEAFWSGRGRHIELI